MKRVSVIPVMVHPEAGVYVLLGRNRGVGWEGAAKWGDFGGRGKQGEQEEDIAARETAEESLETLVKHYEQHIFAKALRDKQYVYKLVNQFNTTYVVRFSWDPSKLYEFSLLRKVLIAFHKLSRGLELSLADQQQLCRYRWFCRDTRLQKILTHPAIKSREMVLDQAALHIGQQRLAHALGLHKTEKTSFRDGRARVVDTVDASWLEKDTLHLFSLEQLRIMLCSGGVWCRGVACTELEDGAKPALQQLCTMLRFHGCTSLAPTCPFEEDEKEGEVEEARS